MPVDIYHTLDQLNIVFQKLLMGMLGLLNASPIDYTAAAFYVRVSWPTTGQPAWKITEDIAFVRVTEEDDAINRPREDAYTDEGDFVLNEATSYNRVLALNLIFYGPNSWSNAQTVRDRIFQEAYRIALAQENLYPIPDIAAPVRAPEVFQSQWWERVDMEIRFNEKIVKNQDISAIEIADVLVYNKDGQVAEIAITAD